MKPVIVTRASKGSRLSTVEGDANFINLRDATITVSDGTNTKAIDLNGIITFTGAHNTAVSVDSATGTITIDTSIPSNISAFTNDSGYITGYTETDPIFVASAAHSITNTNISNWTTAYNYGNHATAGYLTSFTETDPVFSAWNKSTGISITKSQVSDFGSYQAPLVSGSNIRTVNGESLLGNTDLVITSGGLNSLAEDPAPQLSADLEIALNGINFSAIRMDNLAANPNEFQILHTGAVTTQLVEIQGPHPGNSNTPVIKHYANTVLSGTLNGYTIPVDGTTGQVLSTDGVGNLSWTTVTSAGAETDPVFTASASYGITTNDISNWNTVHTNSANYLTSAAIGTLVQPQSTNLNGWGAISTSSKQDTLISGTNIKSINGSDITGAGNLVISSGAGLGSITAYLANGTQDDIQVNANTSLTGLTITQELLADSSMHYAIETTGNYGWNDITGEITVRGSGLNNPTWATVRDGLMAYTFSATTMKECWINFHIPHSYTPGTNVYLHTHWVNPGTNTGVVRWGFEYSFAKGFGQEIFPASQTVYVEQAPIGQYYHMVAEISTGILSTALEVDGILMVRVFRDAAHVNDTNTDAVALLTADIHHQTSRWATKNRQPNFYN